MKSIRNTAVIAVMVLLTACTKEPPPPSVSEFMENSILLESAMVRCARNRSETKYEAECVNAREAANRLATAEEQARREKLEAQSERKRQALRRTLEAAAEARRRAEEARRRQAEAEYLGQFDAPPPEAENGDVPADMPVPAGGPESGAETSDATASDSTGTQEAPADLQAVRDELKRRQDESR
jgi:hypothetical protein